MPFQGLCFQDFYKGTKYYDGATLFTQVGPYQSAVCQKINEWQDVHMWWDRRNRNKIRIRDQERVIDKKLEAWPRHWHLSI